jgi:hypothetical protein
MLVRRDECALDRPALRESAPESDIIHTEFLSPVGNDQPLTAECDPTIVAFVPILLAATSPDYIAGLIAANIVDALKAMAFRGARAYIREEFLEAQPPFRTDTTATPTIPMEFGRFGVSAALNHCAPRYMLGTVRHSMRAGHLCAPAPTRFRIAMSKRVLPDNRHRATRTSTTPVVPADVFKNGKPAELLIGLNNDVAHDSCYHDHKRGAIGDRP